MSPKQRVAKHEFRFGKYILDSLSIGMYSHSLMSLREYIQNSVDAIDCLEIDKEGAAIQITADGRKKSLAIFDNGVGIPSALAKNTLLNIGCSEKDPLHNRGFRGIGRLGGLGYCDELRFSTKARNEAVVSICTWNCKKLREVIGDPRTVIDTESLVNSVAVFQQDRHAGSLEDHFFKVELNAINDGRNDLLNVPAIKSYLSQVAPVPFHSDFGYGPRIDKELRTRVPFCNSYSIFVNGQQVYKPYKDDISLSKGTIEKPNEITFVELRGESEILGFGWYANLSLQGTINPITDVDGLRLRAGNILIGNKDTMSEFFREKRFNNYLVGEIYACSEKLVPNSRRDDFEDSATKNEFITAFIREIGIPLSRKIRQLSRERSKDNRSEGMSTLFGAAEQIIEHGYISEVQRISVLKSLQAVNGDCTDQERKLAAELVNKLQCTKHLLSNIGNAPDSEIIELFKEFLETAYSQISNRNDLQKLNRIMYERVSRLNK